MNKRALRFSWEDTSLTNSALWLVLAKTLAFVFIFALPVLLVRRLTLTEFGLYKQAFLVINTAVALLPLGFAGSAFYFLPREPARQGQVIANIILFYTLVGLVAALTLAFHPTLLEVIFNAPDLVDYAPLMGAVVFLWIGSSFIEVVAVANGEARLAAAFVVTAQLVRALLLLTAAVFFTSLHALIYAAGVGGVLQMVMLFLYLKSRFPEFWRRYDLSLIRAQLAYALPLGLACFLYSLQMDLHHYFVSYQFDAGTYAIYAVGCFQLPLLGVLRDSVGSVMIARVSYLRDKNEIREIVILTARMLRKLAAVFIPAYLFLLVVGPELITVLFTEQYLESWPIFAINLTLIPISMIGTATDPVIRAYPEHRYFLLRTLIVVFIVLLLGLWFGMRYFQLSGAISALVAANLLQQLIVAFRVGRVLGVSWNDLALLRDVGRLALAGAIAGMITVITRRLVLGLEPLIVLVVCAIVFGLVFLVSVLLLGVVTREEFQAMREKVIRVRINAFRSRPPDLLS